MASLLGTSTERVVRRSSGACFPVEQQEHPGGAGSLLGLARERSWAWSIGVGSKIFDQLPSGMLASILWSGLEPNKLGTGGST